MISLDIICILFLVAVLIWQEMRYKSNQHVLKRDCGSIKGLLKTVNFEEIFLSVQCKIKYDTSGVSSIALCE
jgi:hypothetical protein